MFTYKPNPNIKFDDAQKIEAIQKMAHEYTIRNGCEQCKGKNLDISIGEIEQHQIFVTYHCKDCNIDKNLVITHNIFDELQKAEEQLVSLFKK